MLNRVLLSALVYLYVAGTVFALLDFSGVRPDCTREERITIAYRVAAVWPLALPALMLINTSETSGKARSCS